jgi:acyl carrier protein
MNDVRQLDRSVAAALVLASLKDVLALNPDGAPPELSEQTYLIGQGAVLDSLGLVNLILEIEQRLEMEHNVTLVLADERAMSQKHSPFRSVQSLTDYICRLAGEQNAA